MLCSNVHALPVRSPDHAPRHSSDGESHAVRANPPSPRQAHNDTPAVQLGVLEENGCTTSLATFAARHNHSRLRSVQAGVRPDYSANYPSPARSSASRSNEGGT